MSQQPPAPRQGTQQPGWGPPQGPPPQGWQQGQQWGPPQGWQPGWQQWGPPPEVKRPWFKKKRIMIPLLLLGLIVFGSALGGGSDTDGTNGASNDTTTEQSSAAPAAPAADAPEAEAPVPEAPAPAESTIEVSAAQMIAVLESNALKAKNTYEGKTVTVSGFVGGIDASGKYFALDPSPDAFILTGIQVQTGKEFLDQLANFSEDQAVTVTGKITNVGEIMGYSLKAATIQ